MTRKKERKLINFSLEVEADKKYIQYLATVDNKTQTFRKALDLLMDGVDKGEVERLKKEIDMYKGIVSALTNRPTQEVAREVIQQPNAIIPATQEKHVTSEMQMSSVKEEPPVIKVEVPKQAQTIERSKVDF